LFSLSSFGQLDEQNLGELFFDTVYCDGRPVQMAFRHHPKARELVFVGYRQYGRASIDTLTAGRLILPDSVTDATGQRVRVYNIGRQAFAHCHYLTEVVMSDSLMEIGDQSFYDCTALREVTLPKALRVIYPFAFRGCTSLNVVRVKNPNHKIGIYESIFDQQTLDRATLIVPAGTLKLYANSLVFGMFRYSTEAFE
jgi:hypothetical protein